MTDSPGVQAVVFDLDGVLIESEGIWAEVRHRFTLEHGGHWEPGAQRAMMGMSTEEWAAFMHRDLGVPLDPGELATGVVAALVSRYRERLPMLPGAEHAVRRLARRWPLGLASSSPRVLIDLVLERAGLAACFAVTRSTEEEGRGKPEPDVYLDVTGRLAVEPGRCAGVEDSTNGLRALRAAGLRVIAVPNHDYPPDPDVLASADVVLSGLDELTPEVIDPAIGHDRR
jgi:HAD superfamily hydrolase (TIGR01509 family)